MEFPNHIKQKKPRKPPGHVGNFPREFSHGSPQKKVPKLGTTSPHQHSVRFGLRVKVRDVLRDLGSLLGR